jgi:hypothetical protein
MFSQKFLTPKGIRTRISFSGGFEDATPPEASFLNGFLCLRGELAPTQWWHLAELAPMRELAPTLVLKNWPQDL